MEVNLLLMSKNDILNGLIEGKLSISVHGFGYVGASISSAFLRKGCHVIAQDIKQDLVQEINSGSWNFRDDKEVYDTIKEAVLEKRIFATTDYRESVTKTNFHIITVPVSIIKKEKVSIDYSHIVEACKMIGRFMKRGDAVVVETTLPPGTTEDMLKKILEDESNMAVEKDFALIYSPERIFVGRALQDIESNYPKIVAGYGPWSLKVGEALYSLIAKKGIICLSSIKAAEAEKVFEGIYRDVNIALANELESYCEREGLDFHEIVYAANSQPYSQIHMPGVGVGGACIPVYPYFLLAKNGSLKLIRTARKINEHRPNKIVERSLKKFYKRFGKNDKINVSILGLSFRGNVADNRFSPTIQLAKSFLERGCNVIVHDPFDYKDTGLPYGVKFTKDLEGALKDSNIIVVAADHNIYRELEKSVFLKLCSDKHLIVDPKNVLKFNKRI
ncbi:MAG: nucleotide sugar dehydrogenase [Nitrososphaeria archaeon]|nr:nucleotide sugar dehydrogenase [Nitrososphaeria archaeon]